MATHSSTLAWKIPWTEEPGRLQSMGLQRVRNNWVTSLSLFLSCIGEGNDNPLQCSSLENPRDGGAWWAAVCGIARSWTQLKRFSSSSSSIGFSRQEYWSGLPFSPLVDHVLSELSSVTHSSWVVLYGMAHSFNELCKPLRRNKAVIPL